MIKNAKKIIGFLCCLVFCTAIAVGVPQMARAAEIAIDEDNFPDGVFRSYVSSRFDKNNDSNLSNEEIAEIKIVNVEGKNIESLEGIEYLTSLTMLNCHNSQLTSLDVSKNTALISLICSGNQLNSLDVSKNTNLTELNCYDNQLSSLDVNKNTALISLICSGNQLNSLDVSKNTALINLSCEYNNLSSLNVDKNTALTGLYCGSNNLSSLDVSKNTALTELNCYDNQLSSLDISQNTALTVLWFDDNNLSSLDVSKNTALTELRCYNNQLNSLDISKNTALTSLICAYNQLTELKLNSQTYDILSLNKESLHGDYVSLTDLQNVAETNGILRVMDITKPATYKVNGKDFTIIYVDEEVLPSSVPNITSSPMPTSLPSVSPVPSAIPTQLPIPSSSPVVPSDVHIFSDYNYTSPMTSDAPVIYGNGMNKKIDGKKVDNKTFTAYTDILASYKYTPNSNNGTVKASVGKVIVAVTKDNVKPTVNDKNKVTSTVASNVAKAKIKNGQITVTTVGKEGGLVYLWVIDTGNKGVSACCPIDVKLAPKKLEVQNISGSKISKNTKLANGNTLEVCVAGLAGTTKTDDGTYTAEVASKYQGYVSVTPVDGSKNKFTITAKGLKNNKDTKVTITFKCDQNGKKTNLSLTITK